MIAVTASALTLAVCASSVAGQSLGPRLATLAFDRAVQLPGVSLPPGVYVFERVLSHSGGTRVEVSTVRPRRVVATLQVVPVHRPAVGNVVTFRSTAAGVPPAIAAWYPDRGQDGSEFTYTPAQQQALMTTSADALARAAK